MSYWDSKLNGVVVFFHFLFHTILILCDANILKSLKPSLFRASLLTYTHFLIPELKLGANAIAPLGLIPVTFRIKHSTLFIHINTLTKLEFSNLLILSLSYSLILSLSN